MLLEHTHWLLIQVKLPEHNWLHLGLISRRGVWLEMHLLYDTTLTLAQGKKNTGLRSEVLHCGARCKTSGDVQRFKSNTGTCTTLINLLDIFFNNIETVQSCPINHQWLQLGWHDDRLFHYYQTHIPKLQRSRISHVLWILQTPKILWNRKPSRPSLSIPDSQPIHFFLSDSLRYLHLAKF